MPCLLSLHTASNDVFMKHLTLLMHFSHMTASGHLQIEQKPHSGQMSSQGRLWCRSLYTRHLHKAVVSQSLSSGHVQGSHSGCWCILILVRVSHIQPAACQSFVCVRLSGMSPQQGCLWLRGAPAHRRQVCRCKCAIAICQANQMGQSPVLAT